jgi:hypothetical protein
VVVGVILMVLYIFFIDSKTNKIFVDSKSKKDKPMEDKE